MSISWLASRVEVRCGIQHLNHILLPFLIKVFIVIVLIIIRKE
jgi:hypothetical protein